MPVNEKSASHRVDVASISGRHPWGVEQGERAFGQLVAHVRQHADRLINLDLGGVERVDASWSREAIVNLVRHFHGSRWVFLSGVDDESNRENIDAAFSKSGMSIVCRLPKGRFKVLGAPVKDHLVETMAVVEKMGRSTSKDVIAQIKGLGLTACINRLKDLSDAGLVMRTEGSAESGGREFVYAALC